MRDIKGRFTKGNHYSRATEFQPGQHWRPRKPHWDKAWLDHQYTLLGRSACDIATECGCTQNAIFYWLDKHKIPRRSMSAIRAMHHWGAVGRHNPMYGRTGSRNPRYIDGSSPERQRLYAQGEGKQFIRDILKRDGYCCVRCGSCNNKRKWLHIHHIQPWAGHPSTRFDESNVVTLCRSCHSWVHSRGNAQAEYLA